MSILSNPARFARHTPPTPSQEGKRKHTFVTRKADAVTLQLLVALVLTLAGLALLFLGFLFPPKGEIHSSVLVAFGEVSTFAGALFGVDYRYRQRREEGRVDYRYRQWEEG